MSSNNFPHDYVVMRINELLDNLYEHHDTKKREYYSYQDRGGSDVQEEKRFLSGIMVGMELSSRMIERLKNDYIDWLIVQENKTRDTEV